MTAITDERCRWFHRFHINNSVLFGFKMKYVECGIVVAIPVRDQAPLCVRRRVLVINRSRDYIPLHFKRPETEM